MHAAVHTYHFGISDVILTGATHDCGRLQAISYIADNAMKTRALCTQSACSTLRYPVRLSLGCDIVPHYACVSLPWCDRSREDKLLRSDLLMSMWMQGGW